MRLSFFLKIFLTNAIVAFSEEQLFAESSIILGGMLFLGGMIFRVYIFHLFISYLSFLLFISSAVSCKKS